MQKNLNNCALAKTMSPRLVIRRFRSKRQSDPHEYQQCELRQTQILKFIERYVFKALSLVSVIFTCQDTQHMTNNDCIYRTNIGSLTCPKLVKYVELPYSYFVKSNRLSESHNSYLPRMGPMSADSGSKLQMMVPLSFSTDFRGLVLW